jgi:DNA-binding CsgD family transcriptional regulator
VKIDSEEKLGTHPLYHLFRGMNREDRLQLAKYYKKLADDLEREVAEGRAADRELDKFGKRLEHRHGIPDLMVEILQTFQNEADAIPICAERLKISVATVNYHWTAHKREEIKNLRMLRDREILKMARAGKKNAEIARRFGISRPYVSKIVTRYFRQTARYGDHSQSGSP